MSSKKLQVDGIANELEGVSLYFNPPSSLTPNKIDSENSSSTASSADSDKLDLNKQKEGDRLSEHASMPDNTLASTHARMHESKQDDLIETIRKTVKSVGREELFVRLTPDEKKNLREVVYQVNEIYRGNGRKTSDNEVSRIALKFLLEDYRKNGAESILAITQAVLNA